MIADLVLKNRSYRRFEQSFRIAPDILREMVNLARQTPSAMNMQALKYIIVSDSRMCERIFPCFAWARRLNWDGPAEGQRPAAYIIILGDKSITTNFWCDHGIAAQTMLLYAAEKGLGGCMLGSIDREKLCHELGITTGFEVLLTVAVGKPAERVVLEKLSPGGDTSYWRDENGVHHVPKRSLAEVLHDVF